MRPITLNLWSNTGTVTPGALQVISGQVADLADVTQTVDGKMNLTKVTPGDLVAKVLDPDGSIWTFVQTQLATTSGLLPPWLELYVGGTRMFLGTVDPARLTNRRSSATWAIELGAVDWSTQLASTYLGAPTAQPWTQNTLYVQGQQSLNGGSVYQCMIAGTSTATGGGPSGIMGGILWTASTAWSAGSEVIHAGSCYQCVAPGTSAASGGPSGQGTAIADGTATWSYVGPAIVDGTVTWSFVPNTWQRPVPLAASNLASAGQQGFSWDYANSAVNGSTTNVMTFGQQLANVYFLDPQAEWVYRGATVSLDYPVFMAYVPGGTGSGTGVSWWLGYGGSETSWMGPGGIEMYSWVQPSSIPQLTLPSLQFPPGSIAQAIGDALGQQYMVGGGSTGFPANTWNLVSKLVGGVQVWQASPSLHAATLSLYSGEYWNVLNAVDQSAATLLAPNLPPTSPYGPYMVAQLGSSPWPAPPVGTYGVYALGNWTANFTLANPNVSDVEFWTVQVSVPSSPATPCYTLILDSVNGIVPGDTLQIIGSNSSGSWTVAGVDPTLNAVTTLESITSVPQGAHIYWSSESQAEMVMEDPRVILPMVLSPFGCDLSKFQAPATKDPLFGWLPLRGVAPASGPVFAVGDIEPTLTGIKLSTGAVWTNPATGAPMPSYSWTGTPDLGWTGPATAAAAPKADWTCQLAAAPSSLMPYEPCIALGGAAGLNPWQRLRNRCYGDVSYRREDNGFIWVQSGASGYLVNGSYVATTQAGPAVYTYTYIQAGVTYSSSTGSNFSPWTATGANIASDSNWPLVVYDYTAMRRLLFNGGSLRVQAWTGTAWGSATAYTWPGSSSVQSAVPMVGLAGAVLAYSVTAALSPSPRPWPNAITSGDRLELWGLTGGLLASLSLANYSALIGGTLVTTPYGVYLVGGSALAQVIYSGGVLSLVVLYLVDVVDVLFANTLVARTSTELVIFGRYETGDTNSTTETWMFRIVSTLTASLDGSVMWSEKISEGAPVLMGAVRDPSRPGRIVGHLGGSLWQVDTVRPYCIDRWTPGGMTAMEAVEHICQLFNSLAIPDANGTMHIVSRVNSDASIPLTVQRVSQDQTLCWPDFASIVRITSQDSKFFYDAFGQQGGVLLEVDNHPLCWTLSSCAAMAESLAAWFSVVRRLSEEQWTYPDPDTAPPWESVQLFSKVTVNGDPSQRLMTLSQNFIKGTAKPKLVGA